MEQKNELQLLINQLNDRVNQLMGLILIAGEASHIKKEWMPRSEVMSYMKYGDTQMTSIARQYKIATTQIGKRIFYKTSSIIEILNNNQK